MKQPIELRRSRDFGQSINDSFTFLKQNYKPLFSSLFLICGFFLVLGTITTAFTYLKMTSMYSSKPDDFQSTNIAYLLSAFLSALSLLLAQAGIHLVTVCYISVYLQKNKVQPTIAEVWGYFRFYFWRVLGSSILIILLFMVGFILCLIPGFYLMPVLSLIVPIIVIENTSFRYAFNQSFRLIKENWWQVFGVIFITSLIVGVAGSFASVPITIISAGGKFLSLKSFTIPLIIFFSALRNILMLAYTIPSIAVCLCYFSLAEEKDGMSLIERIENFGKSVDNNLNLPIEEY
ncbi:hypothetical protein [Mucilaginibacter xinganensis]|uniref:Glycerophosphoryl diester phosphodiesterase membrane domain-containing protein n=1 Tax=Mucilaginibacter xinganensis TaxID=1234841 RepID=A0A223P1P8_9SPHI|nr:hypothetical protein [Mucilaginibacter xinganensis]ASU36017.1 hypothetical protein MuYL_4132 [Mucilaginibacter xinganensis]